MAYIITSKTRARIMSQPREAAKMIHERRVKSQEKHLVENVVPVNGMDEFDIHQEMDKEGSGIKESMIATSERNAEKTKKKNEAMKAQKEKVVKERIAKLKERDTKNGVLKKAEQKRRKK